jgi:hypothetical protein
MHLPNEVDILRVNAYVLCDESVKNNCICATRTITLVTSSEPLHPIRQSLTLRPDFCSNLWRLHRAALLRLTLIHRPKGYCCFITVFSHENIFIREARGLMSCPGHCDWRIVLGVRKPWNVNLLLENVQISQLHDGSWLRFVAQYHLPMPEYG